MGLLSALSRSRLGALSGARRKAIQDMIASERVPMPVRPMREVGPGGMTVRPPEPFRQSMVGGSDDLLAAARMIRPEDWPQFMALLSAGMGMSEALQAMSAQQNAPAFQPGRVSY